MHSRERPRPFLVHLATASFAFIIALGLGAIFDWSGKLEALAIACIVAAVIVWDIARCRRVTIGPDGIGVGSATFAWQDIELTRVREVPIARAGLFVRLTDEARARHQLPPPHYREFGFGL